ncbi:MAG: ABC transporter permease [Alphaproteobacteria bacterium]|nr:ABC transporter permease [Alphaproteobacteria bacterium]
MGDRSAFWRVYRQNHGAVAGLVVLAAVALCAAIGPLLYPIDPFDMVGRPILEPFGPFPLGTDTLGRDIAAGLIHGARVSLLVGIAATLAATTIGVLIGAVAGYYGGRLDDLLMRGTEFFLTIPSFMLAILLVAIFSPSLTTIIIAIAAVSWPSVARLTRAEFLSLREREYVLAFRAMGMGNLQIMLRHILPNALPPVVVAASLMVATAILTESGLSFLGLGDPNQMTWGNMIGIGRTVLRRAWWMTAIPGVTILITVLAINLVGEGLNDALNPRLKIR